MKRFNPYEPPMRGLSPRRQWALVVAFAGLPSAAFAQASPWLTGANSLVTNIQAWSVPLAIFGIIVFGYFAFTGRVRGETALWSIVGLVLIFGAPQMVTWVRGMFAV
jgi:type IV secretion system protein VirB2